MARPSCSRAAIAPRASPSSIANNIRDTFRVILQMAVVLTYASKLPVVKVGRMAGQFAKPRSSDIEVSERCRAAGLSRRHRQRHRLHRRRPRARSAAHDPRLYRSRRRRSTCCAPLRSGGYANLAQVHRWTLDFMGRSPWAKKYRRDRRPHRRGAGLHGRVRDQPRHRARSSARPSSTPAMRRCCSATSRR